jgi:competence ComEA-like helix-hairpin-helix protein
MREKGRNIHTSKILFLFLFTAVLAILVLGISTDSYAKKKTVAEDSGKTAVALIDLNSADQKTLESLPGIGKSTAKAIIAGRPYKSIDDLKSVKGMSDKKINAIKDKVTIGAAAATAAPAAMPKAAGMSEKASSETKAMTEKAEKTKTKLAPGQLVNINTATKEELDALPGIGPTKAQAIIDGRPYNTTEDIMKVKGIKQKTYDKIKDMITVR